MARLSIDTAEDMAVFDRFCAMRLDDEERLQDMDDDEARLLWIRIETRAQSLRYQELKREERRLSCDNPP